MKIFSFIIFCALIEFILNAYCEPGYNDGVYYLYECSKLTTYNYEENICCMVTYTDYEDDTYNVCYEFSE